MKTRAGPADAHGIPFSEAVRVWAGSRAQFRRTVGQIAVTHRILVKEKRWIGEQFA